MLSYQSDLYVMNDVCVLEAYFQAVAFKDLTAGSMVTELANSSVVTMLSVVNSHHVVTVQGGDL